MRRSGLSVVSETAQGASHDPDFQGSANRANELNPRVAARDRWKRIEALSRLVDFLRAYRSAWRARRAGDADVLFPPGTYQLRIEHAVRCAAPA